MTRQLSKIVIAEEKLKSDKKNCIHIGPCGVGKENLFLNSFYFDRVYSIPYSAISRVYKRVAMSKGGFTGKGIFGSIPYLVVEYDNGKEKQCNFKYEEDVDRLLDRVQELHPEIPRMSETAENRLRAREAELAARKLDRLTPEAEASIALLEKDLAILEQKPELAGELSRTARRKRAFLHNSSSYGYVALAITIAGALSLVYGLYSIMTKGDFALYFTLFGLAAIFLFSGLSVLPTAKNNRKAILSREEEAREQMGAYLKHNVKDYEPENGSRFFPVPSRYAHPIVFTRMIRAIEEGRAISTSQALEAVKAELKSLTSDVEVDQAEYDEVVAIKAMFLNADYR